MSDIKLKLGDREMLVKPEDLGDILPNLVGIDSAYVSVSRSFNARDFGDGKEAYDQGLGINFRTLWESIDKAQLLDPATGKTLQKALNKVVQDKIAMTQLILYRNTLWSLLARVEDLKLRKLLPDLRREAESFGKETGFDPMQVLAKKSTEEPKS